MILDIANLINYASGVMALIFGIAYLIKPPFFSYQLKAKPIDRYRVDNKMQALVSVLMRSISGGSIGFGFIVVVLQHQFAQSLDSWIPITMLVSGGILASTILYVIVFLRAKIFWKPSVVAVLLSVILLVIGYLFNTCISYY